MKLVGFDDDRVGVVVDDRVVELTDLVDVPGGSWPPTAMLRLIRDYDRLRAQIEARAASGAGIAMSEVRLSAPVRWPSKLIAFPANYQRHIEEMRSVNRADHNGFFLKSTASIVGPNDAIVLPPIEGADVHHECELGLVIGAEGPEHPGGEGAGLRVRLHLPDRRDGARQTGAGGAEILRYLHPHRAVAGHSGRGSRLRIPEPVADRQRRAAPGGQHPRPASSGYPRWCR